MRYRAAKNRRARDTNHLFNGKTPLMDHAHGPVCDHAGTECTFVLLARRKTCVE